MRAAVQISIVLALSMSGAVVTSAQQPASVDFTITQRDPGPGADLALRDGLNLRLAYKSTVPVRFQMEGRTQGKAVRAGAMFNVAPLYPAGEGEAIVWIAYHQPGAIDEIVINAVDAAWKPIAATSIPMQIGWSTGMPRRQPAEWVGRLNQTQQEMARHAMEQAGQDNGSTDTLLFLLLPLGLLGYFVLQPWTLMRFNGGWRLAALVPLVAAVPLMLHALLALAAGSNLWPLLLILSLPVATLYLAVLAGVRLLVHAAVD